MPVRQGRRQHAPERRVLLQRFDDLGVDLVTLGELGNLLDELLRQHAFALQCPETFENDSDQRDRAHDDRPHEWAAGPHDFPHGLASYRGAPKASLEAPPGEGITRRARGGESENALRPEAELDGAVACRLENRDSRTAPARKHAGARLGAGHAARRDDPTRQSRTPFYPLRPGSARTRL